MRLTCSACLGLSPQASQRVVSYYNNEDPLQIPFRTQ